MTSTGELKHLPLLDLHREAGARFGSFAGWSMPITYPAGVMKEHLHTRAHAGIFDISHMKLIEISGPAAGALLENACPLLPDALSIQQSKYTFLLNDDGGIIDDLIVTRIGPDRFIVVANAGNAERDHIRFQSYTPGRDVRVTPLDRVLIAVQGPEAAAVISDAGLSLSDLHFMQGCEPHPHWFASRSGYTGEDGFEIAMPVADAFPFVRKLMSDDRTAWVGLAARDSLRLEAGLCLHGQDITEETTPIEAGLTWAIPKELRSGGTYAGAGAVARAVAQGAALKRVGLAPEGRQPVRAGAEIRNEAGDAVGRVTSGGFGPTAGAPVAMGYVPTAGNAIGTLYHTDVRGTRVDIRVCSLPFSPHRYRKG